MATRYKTALQTGKLLVEMFVYILALTLLAQHTTTLSLCSQTTSVIISPYLNVLPIVQALTKHNSKSRLFVTDKINGKTVAGLLSD